MARKEHQEILEKIEGELEREVGISEHIFDYFHYEEKKIEKQTEVLEQIKNIFGGRRSLRIKTAEDAKKMAKRLANQKYIENTGIFEQAESELKEQKKAFVRRSNELYKWYQMEQLRLAIANNLGKYLVYTFGHQAREMIHDLAWDILPMLYLEDKFYGKEDELTQIQESFRIAQEVATRLKAPDIRSLAIAINAAVEAVAKGEAKNCKSYVDVPEGYELK